MIKRRPIFLTALALAPISPFAYGFIRGAGDFIRPYLIGASILSHVVCVVVAVPLMRRVSGRTDHFMMHFVAAVTFVFAYAIVCGFVFSYAEDLAESHAIKVGYAGVMGPREFWDDSGMSSWPTPWYAILDYALLASIIWLPSLIVATILSSPFRPRDALGRNT